MTRQTSFTEHDIYPIIYERKLFRYDAMVEIRNRKNFKRWEEKRKQIDVPSYLRQAGIL